MASQSQTNSFNKQIAWSIRALEYFARYHFLATQSHSLILFTAAMIGWQRFWLIFHALRQQMLQFSRHRLVKPACTLISGKSFFPKRTDPQHPAKKTVLSPMRTQINYRNNHIRYTGNAASFGKLSDKPQKHSVGTSAAPVAVHKQWSSMSRTPTPFTQRCRNSFGLGGNRDI